MKKKIYISKLAYNKTKCHLLSRGLILHELEPNDILNPAVSTHPDMFICKLGIAMDSEIVSGFPAGSEYPDDISFNAASTGKFFIHNLSHTNPALKAKAEELGQVLIDVKQGYTKCSVLIVDENSIITYDHGIAEAAKEHELNVLEITPGHILLPGMDTGFIGGCAGNACGEIVFNGDLSQHPDYESIKAFIESRGIRCVYFTGDDLQDIGSMISTYKTIDLTQEEE